MGDDVVLVGEGEVDEEAVDLGEEMSALDEAGGGFFGGGGVVRKAATVRETRECSLERGSEISPRTNPPRAWHACVRSPRVGERREERTEGKSVLANVGTKIEGWEIDRSCIA
jgi:hypothetical protein